MKTFLEHSEFKVLMYEGIFVDTTLLGKGIYSTDKPHLYKVHQSIDELIETATDLAEAGWLDYVSREYLENLKKCELVNVVLKLENSKK